MQIAQTSNNFLTPDYLQKAIEDRIGYDPFDKQVLEHRVRMLRERTGMQTYDEAIEPLKKLQAKKLSGSSYFDISPETFHHVKFGLQLAEVIENLEKTGRTDHLSIDKVLVEFSDVFAECTLRRLQQPWDRPDEVREHMVESHIRLKLVKAGLISIRQGTKAFDFVLLN